MCTYKNAELESLQNTLRYIFRNENLLELALTHKSFINEQPDSVFDNNERLEFLGDSVLGLVISDFLIRKFSEYSEGALSKLKGFIVSKSFLFDIAKSLNLGDFLKLGRGEVNSGGRTKRSLLVDSLEAIIAAIYLDGGLEKAYDFIILHMEEKIMTIAEQSFVPDYKSILQEYTQMHHCCIPVYKLISEDGKDHCPVFEIEIYIQERPCGLGRGKSKRQAEQDAAKNALINMNIINVDDANRTINRKKGG